MNRNFYFKIGSKRFYSLFYNSARIKFIKKFIERIEGKMLLDAGARNGIFNRVFKELKFDKIVALDIDSKFLKQNNAYERIIINLDFRWFPFLNNSVDCIFASEIIEHLENREMFLKEIYRIIKKDGYLILTTPNRNSLIAKFDTVIRRFVINGLWVGHDFNHKYIFGFKEIICLLENIGFNIVKKESFYLFYGLPVKTKLSVGMCSWIIAQK